MDALKSALQNGCSTIPWSVLQAALAQQKAAADVSASPPSTDGPKMHLDNAQLWRQFCHMTNEMIVTKAGRRMFPVLKLHLSNLEPATTYGIILEFRCTHPHRWRFLNGAWQKGSTSEDNAEQRHVFVHFTSPAPGSQWMQEPVSFAKLKLSNRENGSQKIKLNSLHKYQPHIHLVKLPSDPQEQPHVTTYTFEETQFIAVTAYQNDKVTQMKIKNNPFAKAFLGGNSSERACSAIAMDNFPLEYSALPFTPPPPPPLLPHPVSLPPPLMGLSPPPYPGCSSPHTPGLQNVPYTPQSQDHTPTSQYHFEYQDFHGYVQVYDPDPAMVHSYPYACHNGYEPDFSDYHSPSLASPYPCDRTMSAAASPETCFVAYSDYC